LLLEAVQSKVRWSPRVCHRAGQPLGPAERTHRAGEEYGAQPRRTPPRGRQRRLHGATMVGATQPRPCLCNKLSINMATNSGNTGSPETSVIKPCALGLPVPPHIRSKRSTTSSSRWSPIPKLGLRAPCRDHSCSDVEICHPESTIVARSRPAPPSPPPWRRTPPQGFQ
jgi:hypothetical protein